jgi:ribosome-binding protein aMBF1 (putative translation factor)
MNNDSTGLRRMFPEAGWETPEMLAVAEDTDSLIDFVMLLRSTRKSEGVTQVEIAQRLNTTQSSISEFERIGGDPRIQSLQRYARAMGYRVRLELEKVPTEARNQDQPPQSL